MLKARVTSGESIEINNKIEKLNSIHLFSAIKAMDQALNNIIKDLESYDINV